MIEFDPDLIDITTDPEYQARIKARGPIPQADWAPTGEASQAKRAEMIEIDLEMFDAWIVAMEKLGALDLSDAEFTTARTLLLRRWQRERKRRQHNLHFRYDPLRRRPALVERDARAQLAKLRSLRAELEVARARHYARNPHKAPEGWSPPPDSPSVESVSRRRPAPARRSGGPRLDMAMIPAPTTVEPAAAPLVPGHIDATVIEMIARETGIRDPARAEDGDILKAYSRDDPTGYAGQYFVALLRGLPQPPRPPELD